MEFLLSLAVLSFWHLLGLNFLLLVAFFVLGDFYGAWCFEMVINWTTFTRFKSWRSSLLQIVGSTLGALEIEILRRLPSLSLKDIPLVVLPTLHLAIPEAVLHRTAVTLMKLLEGSAHSVAVLLHVH